jgi:uncharacterized protein (DUF1800 family)
MPSDPSTVIDWNWEKARHLLFRAGFGGNRSEIEEAVSKGLKATVDHLLSGPTRTLPEPVWLEEDKKITPKEMRAKTKEEQQEYQKLSRQHIKELQAGWIQYMISCPTPADMLHEKMSFFWHGHFATNVQNVKGPPFIFSQLKLLHDQALGNFGKFLHAIIRDPAMLRYLNNDQNKKGKPNENLARELMELFSLGGGNYTEKDIQEGARALTGWGIEPYEFKLKSFAHDNGEKTILGKTGKWGGDEFVSIILEQPACATFITRKLWVYFANEKPKESVIQDLANEFRASGYEIKTLLRSLFTHPEFYSDQVVGSQIKSPIQLVVGTSRTLGLSVNAREFYGRMLLMMGQVPYLPPNVKGWPGGRAWIDTSRLVTRYSFAGIIGSGKVPQEIDPRMQGDGDMELNSPEMMNQEKEKKTKEQRKSMMPRNLKAGFDVKPLIGSKETPAEVVDELARVLLAFPPAKEEREILINNLESASKGGGDPIQKLVGDFMMLPAYQLY